MDAVRATASEEPLAAAGPHGGASVIPLRADADPFSVELRRQQLRHDIRHQLGAIMMLASVIDGAPDAGPVSRARSQQIVDEARWMEQLLRSYDAAQHPTPPVTEPVRLDHMAAEVVAALRLTHATAVSLRTDEASVYVDQLALWRALRNLVDNAFRAAGETGSVAVRVYAADGWAVAEVDDDGPGFGAGPAGLASLGLGIVRQFAADHGGVIECGAGALGGARARVRLPAMRDSATAADGPGAC